MVKMMRTNDEDKDKDENQHEDDDVDEVEAEDKLAASYESMLSHMGWVMPKLQRRKLRRLRLKG